MRRALLRSLAGAALAACALSAAGLAHDGPPYPILVDEPFGDRTLSVWADPDVGVGTFYLYLPEEEEAASEAPRITAWVAPLDGHLPESAHVAQPAGSGVPYQRIALADFDERGPWRVRFVLESSQTPAEIATEVEVTPPGAGRIDLLWFFMPFLLVGLLWGRAILQRVSHARSRP